MNKQEILEIRKQCTPDRCTIDTIAGCYVDYEKNKKLIFKEAFQALPEEETYKYFDIFQHTLSGTTGKNLLDLAFPYEEEQLGGAQEFLLTLRDTALSDDALLENLYDKIIASYVNPENYLIILMHMAYDIPGKGTDRIEMEDASEDVYDCILCSICPVVLSKGGLTFNEKKNVIEARNRDWIVEAPVKGFLFPAFNDRNTDIHSALYYTKKADDVQAEFIGFLFGAAAPMSASDQRDTFDTLVTDTIGEEADLETVKSIHDNLQDMIGEHKEDAEPLTLEKADVKKLLEKSGVSDERMKTFDENFVKSAGSEDYPLLASNLLHGKTFGMKTPDVEIRVKPERTDLVRAQVVNKRQCLVVEVNGSVEVNGVPVKIIQ